MIDIKVTLKAGRVLVLAVRVFDEFAVLVFHADTSVRIFRLLKQFYTSWKVKSNFQFDKLIKVNGAKV